MGIANAANKVIAVMHVNILDFMLHLVELGAEGAVQSNHCEGTGRNGAAERDHSTPKAAGVKVKLLARTRNAVSDGAFAAARMHAQGEQPIIPGPAKTSL